MPDCHLPANPIYRTTMHIIHVINIPLYLTIIIVLLRIKSKHFQHYKYYLIWQTVLNEATELHNAYLMLPVVHLPFPLLRATGILADLGFSGLFMFYILSMLIMQTGCTILEMFYFRYRASLLDYKSRSFSKYLKGLILSCRFCVLLFPILVFSTFSYSVERQDLYKHELLKHNPSIFPEITCYSVVLAAPFSDSVMIATMIIWLALIIITFSMIPTTTIYLNAELRKGLQMSAAVVKMQRMLLSSLIVQTFVHGIMLGVPNLLFVYAIFFGAEYESIAYTSFISLTFHGLFSSVAMLLYTKPIQAGVLQLFTCNPIAFSSTTTKSTPAQPPRVDCD